MTIIHTYAKLNRKIRHLNKIIKIQKNLAKAYREETEYHQAVIDNLFPNASVAQLEEQVFCKH